MNYIIGITTFSKRYNLLENLVRKIRKFTNVKILLCINGDDGGEISEEYRLKVLNLCMTNLNIYPIFFTETRGLSKMWNTIVIHSHENNVLMLNDDLDIHSNNFFDLLSKYIIENGVQAITRINNSFSHFLISKEFLDTIGYFDERLLGFGEEDGDIIYRCIKNGYKLDDIYLDGVTNIISDLRHDHIKPGIGKYSLFNRNFIYEQKYVEDPTSTNKGIFDNHMRQVIDDINCYPYESYFRHNKSNL
jgi:hypothetical protein